MDKHETQPWIAIAAVAANNVIGNNDKIPWHLPEDFKWFRQKTLNNIVVMGRKTYESMGKPLPKRHNIVITRQAIAIPNCQVIGSIEEIAEKAPKQGQIFIIGGAEIYRMTLPFCSELLITHVKAEYEGNVFFPTFTDDFTYVATIQENEQFVIKQYRNKRLGAL